MKKLILLSFLLLGCLTNYAQFYKVIVHKPGRGWDLYTPSEKLDDDTYLRHTIILTNGDEIVYQEKRALVEIPDSIFYVNNEPKTLKYRCYVKVKKSKHEIGPNTWEQDFDKGEAGSLFYDDFGYGWNKRDGYVISRYSVKVTYEQFRCECEYATIKDIEHSICPETRLNCRYNFELPFNSSVYLATTANQGKKYNLNIKLAKGETSFSVSAKEITDIIGYYTPFDIYILCDSDYEDILKVGDVVGKTNFNGIKKNISYEKPYIKDNKLVIPDDEKGLNKKCNFVFEGKTVSKNYKAIDDNNKPQFIPTGQYQLQISDTTDTYCQVNLDAYVPEIEYNYLDTTRKEFTHWHSEDTTQAINLKIYNVNNNSLKDSITITESYPTNSNHTFKCKPGNKTIEDNLTYYKEHAPTDSTIPLFATPYYITCYPDLDSITIVPKDTLSIPTIITIKDSLKASLKAYPPIHVDVITIPDSCFYDTHKVKIDSISGGLSNGYKYAIDNSTFETEIHQGDTIVIPNNNQKEFSYKLAFYDANISTEDSIHGGKKARSFTTNETHVTMPDTLGVDKYEITDVACHGDATGKIQILSLKYADPNRPISYLWNTNSTQNFIDNLPIGTYSLKLSDGVCSVNSEYEIKQPNQLIFKKIEANDASCFGYNDGSIIVSPDGGVKPYTYWLNDSIVSRNITKLIAADYHITVADSNNCIIERDTKISEPTKVENNFIAHDYSICQDSELEIDAGDFYDYIWKNPEGKTLDAKNILTLNNSSPEGEYYLKTIRYDDCFAEDTITIVQSKESLKMNFLLPSDIYNDDHAKIVETSSHELDSLKWSFSENLIGDFPKDSTTLTISTNALDKLSTYKIKLTGYYKGCISTVTKNLNISNLNRPEEEYIPDFYDSDEILDCRIGPNPNNGNFTLFLDLDCAKDAVLTIYSISSYKYVLREKLVGLQNYEHSINQNLQQGLYILEVKTPKSIRRIKFEVTR